MILISYRRRDSKEVVDNLYHELLYHVLAEMIFRDLDSLFAGDDFPDMIRTKLSKSCLALVVIGPKWLEILHERKDDPVDYVREEVRLALESGIAVVPVTVSNADMPTESELAEFPDLQPLALRNGVSVRPEPDIQTDMQRLVGKLSSIPGSPLTTVAQVQDFLQRLALNGLKENVVYLPPQLKPDEGKADKPKSRVTVEDLVNFCLPVRVVDEQEWQRLEQQRTSPGQSRFSHTANDRDYIFATSEEFWRMDGEQRATPRPLESVFASNRRVVLRGEPGEGKTTSLFLHIAHRCRELDEGLGSRKFGLFSPQCRIPLPLPLSKAAPTNTDEPFCVRQARDEALRLAYKEVEQAPPQVAQWLDEKISRGEVDLCLDALDELDVRWHEPLREELDRDESVNQCEIGIFLTTRLSADDTKVIRNARRYRMVCFGPAQVRDFITRYFSRVEENGEQLAHELRDQLRLSPGPRHLAQIPLLLALLCQWLSSRWEWPIEKIRQEIPKTRTALLHSALHSLMERGDAKRLAQDDSSYVNPVSDESKRNKIKESVLRHVAWHFFATGPLPIVKDKLIELLADQLKCDDWTGDDPPRNAEMLLKEFLQDGVLVRQDRGVYRFVLRSFHEYCLAGWIARECRLIQPKEDDREEFIAMIRGRTTEWGRIDWADIKPLNQPAWENVWPFVAGQLEHGADWFIDALVEEEEDLLASRIRLAGSLLAESTVARQSSENVISRLIKTLLDDGEADVARSHCAAVLADTGHQYAKNALLELLVRPVEQPRSCAVCGKVLVPT
jgi:hypothetical protein